jgi:mRNA guanylyltransferase
MKTRDECVHGTVALARVMDPDLARVLEALRDTLGFVLRGFPGAMACSLERADMPTLAAQPYYVCEKTDGVRCLLFCCTLGDGTRVCALVDRKLSVFLLPLRHMSTAMFQGSVVDCEVARNKVAGAWQLLVFDAYVLCGVKVHHAAFSDRMRAAHRALAVYRPHPEDAATIRVKTFYATTEFFLYREAEAGIARHFDIDGVVLTPELSPAVFGKHPGLFKVKTHHTVDFKVGKNGLDLYVFQPALRCDVRVAKLVAPAEPGSIVECTCPAGHPDAWAVYRVRTDKRLGNDHTTYSKTVLNMREGITYDDLQAAFDGLGSPPP